MDKYTIQNKIAEQFEKHWDARDITNLLLKRMTWAEIMDSLTAFEELEAEAAEETSAESSLN